MRKRRGTREPLSSESFEWALEEEMLVSAEFDLPLTLLVARAEDGWDPEATRRVLDSLRAADLVAQLHPRELAIVLPNTAPGSARAVETRVRKALPSARVGLAAYEPGDAVPDLLERAQRAAAEAEKP